MVLDVVEDFDNSDHWPGWLLPVGPELAAALIDDGLAASTPRWQSRLLDVVLRTLNGHVPRDLQELSVALATVTADAETLLSTTVAFMVGVLGFCSGIGGRGVGAVVAMLTGAGRGQGEGAGSRSGG